MDEMTEFRERLIYVEDQIEAINSTSYEGIIGAVVGALIAATVTWLIYRWQNKHSVAIYDLERLEKFACELETLIDELIRFTGDIAVGIKYQQGGVHRNPELGAYLAIPKRLKFQEKYGIEISDLEELIENIVCYAKGNVDNANKINRRQGNRISVEDAQQIINEEIRKLDVHAEKIREQISSAMNGLRKNL